MECLPELLNQFGDKISKTEAEAILKELEKMRSRYFEKTDGPTRAGFEQRAMSFLNDRRKKLYEARRQALLKVEKKSGLTALVSQPQFKNQANAYLAFIEGGSGKTAFGMNRSPEALKIGFIKRWGEAFTSALHKADFLKFAKNGEADIPLAQAIFDFSMGKKPKTTGPIADVALAFHKINQDILRTLQLSGSSVRERLGRITEQTHDPHKIGKVDAKEWKKAMREAYDMEESFPNWDEAEIEAKLDDDYRRITMGRWGVDDINKEDAFVTADGLMPSISERTGRGRTYIPKSPEAWVKYNSRFGRGTISQVMYANIRKHAANAAMLQSLGPHPEQMHATMKQVVQQNMPANEWAKMEKKIDAAFRIARGTNEVVGMDTAAKVAQIFMNLQAAAKLGGTLLTAIPTDIISAATRLKNSGDHNIFSATLSVLQEYVAEFASASERTKALRDLTLMIQDLQGMISDGTRYGQGGSGFIDGALFWTGEMAGWTWSLGGMRRHTAVMDTVMSNHIQRRLASWAEMGWDKLSHEQRVELGRYGFTEHEWGFMQHAVEEVNGVKYLTAEGISRLPKEFAENAALKRGVIKTKSDKLFEDAVKRYHFSMESNLVAMVQDHVAIATTTPGVKERRQLLGAEPGIIRSLMMQWKMVPMQVLNETARQMESGHGISGVGGAAAALTTRVVGLTAAGYAALALKDLKEGKTPRSPWETTSIVEAFARGGAGGLYADAILGAIRAKEPALRVLSEFAGPTFSTGAEVADIGVKAMKGEKVRWDAVRTATQNIPIATSLWWSKKGFDQLLFNQFREWASPGYLRRQELKTYQNQDIFGDRQNYLHDSLRPTNSARFIK